MSGNRLRLFAAAAAAAMTAVGLFCAGAANASGVGGAANFAPNYTFADGAKGFKLTSHGGPINPGVLVGFNPQPDPPGIGDDGLLIALLNPGDPKLISPSTGGAFSFRLALQGFGDGSVIPLPDAPNSDGFTSLRFLSGLHAISISLQFGPNQVDQGSWKGFNPQPDPPGDVLAGQFNFTTMADPFMAFEISIDGQPLTFAMDDTGAGVPEPATWGLMLLGFGGLGAALRARRRTPALA
ncbi:PEPxxWA-CTERM sorting domain-containing protein [Phenylobacterium sp.]|uniref:PEPxxWA-CTERM sorting domain-containing protein n=1 Tax=Phenylobacterium sp. TaxID=1871053 RepID=UPI00374CD334